MKKLCLFVFLLGLAAGRAWAMPPHPELVARIRAGLQAEPYFLRHYAELKRAGVNAPVRSGIVDRLARRALDENIHMIAILVDFSDNAASVAPTFFDTLLYGPAFGSLRHYYSEVSYGSLTLVSLNLPSSLGWQRAPQTYDYYVNNAHGFGAYPRNAQRLAEDAVTLVDPMVDFSVYDNDGDGEVDALFIIHAGPGAEYTGRNSDIWSHAWQLRSPRVVDGVVCRVYSMEPEYYGRPGDMSVGVYAHEMGHAVFGLPDLYDYDGDSQGLGAWTLMAGGSWNGGGRSPAHPDAFCRVRMGVVEPVVLTQNLLNARIPAVQDTPVIYRLWTNGQGGREYFLIENRQRTGYDTPLPGAGLLIYHVDEAQSGNNNQWYPGYTSRGHYLVALEQADGLWQLERDQNSGNAGDPYPGSSNNRTFDNISTPNSRSYANQNTRVAVRNISNSAAVMTADLYVRGTQSGHVLALLDDTTAVTLDTVCVEMIIEGASGLNVRAFEFLVQVDSSLLTTVAPYYSEEGSTLPPDWSVIAVPATGSVRLFGTGTTPLVLDGPIGCLTYFVSPTAPNGSVCPVRFASCRFNNGVPPADSMPGSVTITSNQPIIYLVPNAITFSPTRVGGRSTRAFSIRNSGYSDLVVEYVDALPPFSTDFVAPQTIAPNTWVAVRVTFEPTAERLYQDSIVIYSNVYTSPTRLPVSGQGLPPMDVGDDRPPLLPERFALAQNVPNPFNAVTEIEFDVPKSANVALRVYDLTGREVQVLLDGPVPAGRHHLTWNAGDLGAGLYLVAMTTDNFRAVRKALLVK